jgi:hypothetical protein
LQLVLLLWLEPGFGEFDADGGGAVSHANEQLLKDGAQGLPLRQVEGGMTEK